MKTRTTHTEYAHAKVNLCLAVQHPPINGYHKLDSVFQELSLCDILRFEFVKRDGDECAREDTGETGKGKGCEREGTGGEDGVGGACEGTSGVDDCKTDGGVFWQHGTTAAGTHITLNCAGIGETPIEKNLIFKAIDLMERAHGKALCDFLDCGNDEDCNEDGEDTSTNCRELELRIDVEKHIPAGGGLGGGSSDAAACIRAFSKFAKLNILCEKNLEVARGLGADVAFFLYGGCALMTERGDVLVKKLPSFPLKIVLMGSCGHCNTGEVYSRFDNAPLPAADAQGLADAIESYESADSSPIAKSLAAYFLANQCANNLQEAAFETLPILRERISAACEHEAVLNALVTGSGATSYAICANDEHAQEFAKYAKSFCDWVEVVDAL